MGGGRRAGRCGRVDYNRFDKAAAIAGRGRGRRPLRPTVSENPVSRTRIQRSVRSAPRRKPRKKSAGRRRPALRLGPQARQLWRWFCAAPLGAQLAAGLLVLIAAWAVVNAVYQVVRKPAELFFPVSGVLVKTPAETWEKYGRMFRAHSTRIITPELLAALAQVESTGDPVARTYWRWRASWDPFEIYRPASSAVGMYQITNATFREARRYCIHRNTVVEDGPWYDFRSCWFNRFYMRVVPSHAAEMTSAYLDRRVTQITARLGGAPTLQQQQDLAIIIHLCGPGAGEAYARAGFRLRPGQRCGDHDVARYLAKVNAMKDWFARRAAAESAS